MPERRRSQFKSTLNRAAARASLPRRCQRRPGAGQVTPGPTRRPPAVRRVWSDSHSGPGFGTVTPARPAAADRESHRRRHGYGAPSTVSDRDSHGPVRHGHSGPARRAQAATGSATVPLPRYHQWFNLNRQGLGTSSDSSAAEPAPAGPQSDGHGVNSWHGRAGPGRYHWHASATGTAAVIQRCSYLKIGNLFASRP